MNMIYNSAAFCVVEFAAVSPDDSADEKSVGGYEIMDKVARRGIFIDGPAALAFRDHVAAMIEDEPSMDDIDEFLNGFSPMMQQPVVLH